VIRCHYCGAVIGPDERFRQAVWGWEAKPTRDSRKGGSDIEHRQRFERYAHALCIDRERAGVSARQQALV
jgi:hypothetical protein